jgi:hypothetical protein
MSLEAAIRLNKDQLDRAWKLLDELDEVLRRVGGTDEEWNVFTRIQSEVKETKEAVSG